MSYFTKRQYSTPRNSAKTHVSYDVTAPSFMSSGADKQEFKTNDRVVYIGIRLDMGFYKFPGQGQAGTIQKVHNSGSSYAVKFDGNYGSTGIYYISEVLQENLAEETSREAIDFQNKVREIRFEEVEAKNKTIVEKRDKAKKYLSDYRAWKKDKSGTRPKFPQGLSDYTTARRHAKMELLDATDPIDKSQKKEKKKTDRQLLE